MVDNTIPFPSIHHNEIDLNNKTAHPLLTLDQLHQPGSAVYPMNNYQNPWTQMLPSDTTIPAPQRSSAGENTFGGCYHYDGNSYFPSTLVEQCARSAAASNIFKYGRYFPQPTMPPFSSQSIYHHMSPQQTAAYAAAAAAVAAVSKGSAPSVIGANYGTSQ